MPNRPAHEPLSPRTVRSSVRPDVPTMSRSVRRPETDADQPQERSHRDVPPREPVHTRGGFALSPGRRVPLRRGRHRSFGTHRVRRTSAGRRPAQPARRGDDWLHPGLPPQRLRAGPHLRPVQAGPDGHRPGAPGDIPQGPGVPRGMAQAGTPNAKVVSSCGTSVCPFLPGARATRTRAPKWS